MNSIYSGIGSFVFYFAMVMRLILLGALLVQAGVLLAQKYQSKVHFSAIYDNILFDEIPSYQEIPAIHYRIYTEGIYNTVIPTLSVEAGYTVERNFWRSKKIYSGLRLGYRRTQYSYVDKNLYYVKISNGQITEIFFQADLKRNLTTIQIPIGLTVPLSKKFSVDFAVRNNFILKASSQEEADDNSFAYKLSTLEQRSTNIYMLEVSAGVKYDGSFCSLGLGYIQGLTSIYPDLENAYNHKILGRAYFSSILLSAEIPLKKITHPK